MKMVIVIQVLLLTKRSKDLEFTIMLKMDQSTKGSGKKTKEMAKENCCSKMVVSMKEIGLMTNGTAKGDSF